MKPCKISECHRPHKAKGYCSTHYRRALCGRPIDKPVRVPKGALLAWIRGNIGFDGSGCLTWPFGGDRNGYGLMLYEGRHSGAHRVMCIEAHGPPPSPDREVAHSCGRGAKGCVHPKHVRWATRLENHADKKLHGTYRTGEGIKVSKLKSSQVAEIRSLAGKMTNRKIAAMFGMSPHQIGRIVKGQAWV